MTSLIVENGHQNNTCFDKSGLCVQNILDSRVNAIGRVNVMIVQKEEYLHFVISVTLVLWFRMTILVTCIA